jgi:hypothetical protein
MLERAPTRPECAHLGGRTAVLTTASTRVSTLTTVSTRVGTLISTPRAAQLCCPRADTERCLAQAAPPGPVLSAETRIECAHLGGCTAVLNDHGLDTGSCTDRGALLARAGPFP